MGPRGFTLPKATTASAKAARAAFFCDLCQKGYSRMNEFDAHESSYDHQHKKRLKEMKEMQRQVTNSTSKKEEKGPLMSIKLGGPSGTGSGSGGGGGGGNTGGAGFKKGGFKNAFAPVSVSNDDNKSDGLVDVDVNVDSKQSIKKEFEQGNEPVDSDVTDDEDYYDPRRPTGCTPGCTSYIVTSRATT